MREFDYSRYKDMKWGGGVLSLVAGIYKEAGKQEIFLKQRPMEMEKLVELTKILSTEKSNEIEGIFSTSTRLRLLMEEKAAPRNRAEQEIAGYRDVLNLILESYEAIAISPNYILQLHKILYGHMNVSFSGRTKTVQNYIAASFEDGHRETLFAPVSPFETPEALEKICREYDEVIANGEVEPLLVIPIFILDFLCIHPFNDGNGRMSRLLTTLLLLQNGFPIGRYMSLEAKIAKNKDLYYDSLFLSQKGWHEGENDPLPFIEYLLGTILSAYKDFGERASLLEEKLPAKEMVRKAVSLKIGKFSKSDIVSLCPSLSLSSIEVSLRKLVEEGEVERVGQGKRTQYMRKG